MLFNLSVVWYRHWATLCSLQIHICPQSFSVIISLLAVSISRIVGFWQQVFVVSLQNNIINNITNCARVSNVMSCGCCRVTHVTSSVFQACCCWRHVDSYQSLFGIDLYPGLEFWTFFRDQRWVILYVDHRICGNIPYYCYLSSFLVMLRLLNKRSKSNFFLKIELNRNQFFAGVFFRFWLTAILAKTTHCSKLRCAEYADLITRIACRGGRAVRLLQ